jgi:rhamnose transport system permease protein
VTTLAEDQKLVEPQASSHVVAELLLRFRELGIVLALVIVVAATTIDNPHFLSATNVQQILSSASIIALLAIGETIVIITRNGAVVTIARVPSLVVTLGTLYIIRGIDGAWAGGNQVNASMLPNSFNKIGYGTIAGIPYLGIIGIVAVAIATYAMRTFRTARDFYAIGSDPQAARLAGIPVGSRVFLAFVLSGGIAGLAGAVWLSYYGSVDAIAGVGYEFQVITAVVVGGVAIFGGSGTVLGAALGALLLNTINSALVVVNVSSFWSSAVAGALLIGAIAFDRLIAVRVAPALRTRRRSRG